MSPYRLRRPSIPYLDVEYAAIAAAKQKQLLLLAHREHRDVLLFHSFEELDRANALRDAIDLHLGHVPHFQDVTVDHVGWLGLHRLSNE